MKLRQNSNVSTKHKLSGTLRGWLPFLVADIESLKETLDKATKDNPFVQIKSGNEVSESSQKSKSRQPKEGSLKNSVSNEIESMSTHKESLYDVLTKQIVAPLFPTEKSKKIAYMVIDNINPKGYFDGDMKNIAKDLNEDVEVVNKIRLRFQYLEPSGVGAIDLLESFLFQLNELDIKDDVYKTASQMIKDFENLELYQKDLHFDEALKVIRKCKNPPAISYLNDVVQIIPDIYINNIEEKIEVKLNETYYPDIVIDLGGVDDKFDFVKEKVKEAKSLIDALELRKETLMKVALMLVEYQYEFFQGGSIKPMKLDDLAGELDRHHSTISRAVSNKFISCNRGVFPIKSFFAVAMGEDKDISNSEIKTFIVELIKNENRLKPLSDSKIVIEVEKKYDIKLGRRTVTKYRSQAGISSSSERKKLYSFT